MTLRFTALEIGSGDAFLLEDNGMNILFDSGGCKTKIVRVLKENNINHIHLAICSHNDKDHANGFIGLLNSKISVEEIWLPGIWSNIMQYIRDHGNEFDAIRRFVFTHGVKFNNDVELDYDSLFNDESVSIECFDDTVPYMNKRLSYIPLFADIRDIKVLHEEMGKCFRCKHKKQCDIPIVINLTRINEIVQLAYKKGSNIRWFEPMTCCNANNAINNDFIALNSRQICRVRKIKDTMSFIQALSLTEENKHSLVFEYLKNGIPIVRFSADSNCTCQSVYPYKNHIIVTAPHHGSEANDNVYKNLKGDDIIWVRSDRKSQKRPCATFKGLSNKYCLACSDNNFKARISFNYDFSKNRWDHLTGNACDC